MISDREKLIGMRLRAFRESLQIPRAAFAATVGFGSERIAAYEAGRARLPYLVFQSISKRYHLYPGWLADGQGTPQIEGSFDDSDFIDKIQRHALFTEIYDEYLVPQLVARAKGLKRAAEDEINRVLGWIHVLNDKTIPEQERVKMRKILAEPLEKFTRSIDEAVKSKHGADDFLSKILSGSNNQSLTNVVSSDNIQSVKAQLPELLKRLNEATRERGTKTALAKFMGVDLPTVSRWLSGEKEPGGETTLRLLHWVEQQERK